MKPQEICQLIVLGAAVIVVLTSMCYECKNINSELRRLEIKLGRPNKRSNKLSLVKKKKNDETLL